jgi:polyhydroxyalkanoate synthesis regulator phasin
VKEDYSKLFQAVFDEVRGQVTDILVKDGKAAAEEFRPYVENIAKWSGDYAVAAIQGDQHAHEAMKMLTHQAELLGVLLSQRARDELVAIVKLVIPIVVRTILAILVAV